MNLTNKSIQNMTIGVLAISCIIGVGLSYSSVYFFHLALLFSLIFFTANILTKKIPINQIPFKHSLPTLYFIVITFFWFLILLFFSESTKYGVFHLTYISMGGLIILLILFFTKTRNDLKRLIFVLAIIVGIDLLIGFSESIGLFRWFISRLSPIVQHFGYTNELDFIISKSLSSDYVKTMPTGFQYNPNDFAVLVGLVLPFFIRSTTKIILSTIGACLIIWLCIASGAKIVLLTCFILLFVSLLLTNNRKQFIAPLTTLLFIFFLITNGFGIFQGKSIKINEAQVFCYNIVGITPPDYVFGQLQETKSSGSTRLELTKYGIQKSIDNHFIGYGGGQSRYQMEKTGGVTNDKICSLHSFTIELLFEGGIIYLLIFMLWYIYVLYGIFKIYRSTIDPFEKYISASLLISLIGFVILSNAPSSVIYYLPMYLLFGISVSFIKINKYENSITC